MSEWLFPNVFLNDQVTRQTISKQVADRQVKEGKKPIAGRTAHADALKLPGGRWTVHDLRRTAASAMAELDVMPHIVKKCLNQKNRDIVQETYQRAKLWKQQTEAFQTLGDYLAHHCKAA